MTKNIGISVKKSTKPPIDGEKNNPFNGSLSIRGKLFEGIIVNAKAKQTVTIEKKSFITFTKFRRYGKSKNRTGRNGKDLFLKVPKGTLIWRVNNKRSIFVGELLKENDSIVIAKGGKGGSGNKKFVAPKHRLFSESQNFEIRYSFCSLFSR